MALAEPDILENAADEAVSYPPKKQAEEMIAQQAHL